MKEDITDADNYVDWIQWAVDEEQRKQNLSEGTNVAGESVLLQIQQMEITDFGAMSRSKSLIIARKIRGGGTSARSFELIRTWTN